MDEEDFREFLIESYESVEFISKKLSELEKTNYVCDVIDEIYRRVHKIHGISGFLEFKTLENISKQAQFLLVELRKDPSKTSKNEKQVLVTFNDTVKLILTNIQTQKNEGRLNIEQLNKDFTSTIAELRAKNSASSQEAQKQDNVSDPEDWDKLSHNISSNTDKNQILIDVTILDNLLDLVNERLVTLQIQSDNRHEKYPANCPDLKNDFEFLTTIIKLIKNVRLQSLKSMREELFPFVNDMLAKYNRKVRIIVQDDDIEIDKLVVTTIKEAVYKIIFYFLKLPQPKINTQTNDTQGLSLDTKENKQSDIIVKLSYDMGRISLEILEGSAKEESCLNPVQIITTNEVRTTLETLNLKIKSLGGKLDQFGVSGKLTSVRVTLPSAIMAVPMLMVESHGERFLLPRGNIVKLLKIDNLQIREQIEEIDGIYFYKNYHTPLPVIPLSQALNIETNPNLNLKDNINLITVRVHSEEFGIIVDNIYQIESSLIKPLNKLLENHQLFSAVSILSDGSIAFVLDCSKIGDKFSLIRDNRIPSVIESFETVTTKSSNHQDRLIVVKIDQTFQVAIPINKVNKLEKISSDNLIRQNQELFIKLKSQEVIPLIIYGAHEHTKQNLFELNDFISTVIITDGEKTLALLIESIIGITEQSGDDINTNLSLLFNDKSEGFITSQISKIVNVDDLKILESMYH